jgi:hypothetical protein
MKIGTRVALAACVALGAGSPASANHWWGGYHWARTTAGELALRVNYSVDSKWLPYVQTSIREWDAPVKRSFETQTGPDTLTLTSGPVSVDRRKCNPIRGQALVCNNAYGKRGWLGIASIWTDGTTHIVQATTKLNDSYYGTGSSYDNYGFRALVACQEVGHDFGLAHQNENFTNLNVGSCMDYTNNPMGGGTNGTKQNDKPNFHDYDELGIIYADADSYTTVGSLTSAATNFGAREVGKAAAAGHTEGSGDTTREWGTPTHRDGKGRPDQFVRRFSDGTTMITHVLWAPDAKGTEAN